MIAADAGAPVERRRYLPAIQGMLLTGGRPRFLSARIIGGQGFESTITDAPAASPAAKIAATYLAPYLEELEAAERTHAPA